MANLNDEIAEHHTLAILQQAIIVAKAHKLCMNPVEGLGDLSDDATNINNLYIELDNLLEVVEAAGDYLVAKRN